MPRLLHPDTARAYRVLDPSVAQQYHPAFVRPDTSAAVDATTPPGHGGSSIVSDLTGMAVRPVVAGKRLVTGQAQREHTLGADTFDTALGIAQIGLPLVRGASAATSLMRAGLEGVAIGAGGEGVRVLDDLQGPTPPTLGQAARRMAGGAIIGGTLGAGSHLLFNRLGAEPTVSGGTVPVATGTAADRLAALRASLKSVEAVAETAPRTVKLTSGTMTQGGYGDAVPVKPIPLKETVKAGLFGGETKPLPNRRPVTDVQEAGLGVPSQTTLDGQELPKRTAQTIFQKGKQTLQTDALAKQWNGTQSVDTTPHDLQVQWERTSRFPNGPPVTEYGGGEAPAPLSPGDRVTYTHGSYEGGQAQDHPATVRSVTDKAVTLDIKKADGTPAVIRVKPETVTPQATPEGQAASPVAPQEGGTSPAGHTVVDTGKGRYRYQVLDPQGQPVPGSVGPAPMRFATRENAVRHAAKLDGATITDMNTVRLPNREEWKAAGNKLGELSGYATRKADDWLNGLGEPGKLVIGGFRDADLNAERRAGQAWNRLSAAGLTEDGTLSFPEHAAINLALEGKLPLDQAGPIGEALKKELDTFQQARHAVGMHTTQGDYLPRDYRFHQLRTDPTYRAEAIQMADLRGNAGANPEATLDAMLSLEKDLRPDHPFVNWYMGEHPEWMQGQPEAARRAGFLQEFDRQRRPASQEAFGHMRERVLDLPFYDHNINRIASAYIGGAARTIERAKIFGVPGQEDYLLADNSPLVQMIPDSKGRDVFLRAVNRKLGVGKEGMMPTEKQVFQDKRALDAFKIGPVAGAINYLNAPLGIFQHSGYDPMLTLKSTLRSKGGFDPAAVEGAVGSGAVEATVPIQSGRRHGLFGQDDVGGDLQGRLRKGFNTTSKVYQTLPGAGTAMIPSERAGRVWSNEAGAEVFDKFAADPTKPFAARYLSDLGLDPATVGSLTPEEYAAWRDKSGNFFSKRVMGKNRPGDLPPMFENPMWRAVNPLKSFMYLQGRETLDGFGRSPSLGLPQALAGGAAFVGGNLAAGEARRRFEDKWKESAGETLPEQSLPQILARDARYSPLLGAFSDVLSMGPGQAVPAGGAIAHLAQGEELTPAQKRWLLQGGPVQVGALRYLARRVAPNP